MKERTRIKRKQLKVIIVSWMIMGFLITVYDFLVLHTSNSAGLSQDYSFLISVLNSQLEENPTTA